MSAIPIGYSGKLSKGSTPTTLTSEPTSALANDVLTRKRYQVTNAAKRVLDPATAIVVKENGTTSTPTNIAFVDAQAGIVIFAVGYTPATPVTFTGKYIPRAAIALVKEMDSEPEVNTQDVTQINSAGYDQMIQTTFKWSGSFTIFDYISDQGLDTYITGRLPLLVDFDPDSTGTSVLRGWVLISKTTGKISPKAANESEVDFELFDQSNGATALSGFQVNAAFSAFVT